MARCEDFPCCGHYDEGTYNSWCPNEDGLFPCSNCGAHLPLGRTSSLCANCFNHMMNDDSDGDYEPEYELEEQEAW